MINYDVPFYPNLKSNTHCYQSCLKMVLKYFWPKKNFTFKQLDKITAKEPGMWSWEMAGVLWLKQQGFDVKVMQVFDYNKFAKNPKEYLIKTFDQKTADEIDKHTILENEKKRARDFIKHVKPIKKIPEISNIKHYLVEGYLVVLSLNSNVLNKMPGYCGHLVLVKGFEGKHLIVHNPGGYPGKPNQKIAFELFEKAWAYPNKKAKNIIAIKK